MPNFKRWSLDRIVAWLARSRTQKLLDSRALPSYTLRELVQAAYVQGVMDAAQFCITDGYVPSACAPELPEYSI